MTTTATPTAFPAVGPTMTEQFRTEYARGLVPAMLSAMRNAHTAAMVLLGVSLAVTYFHVAAFLGARPAFGILGWVLPLIIDGGLMVLFHILTVRALNTASKVMAGVGATFAAYLSIALNWSAAGADPMAARMYAGVVGFAIFIKATAAVMGPNFAAMAKAEGKAAPIASEPVVDEQLRARRSEAALKGAETRRQRQQEQQRVRDERNARRRAAHVAPVSPATVAEIDAIGHDLDDLSRTA